MGQSTNGLLYYGFTFCDPDEDGDPPWATEDDGDWEDWFCEKLGGPPAPGVEYSDETRQQFHAYWDESSTIAPAITPCTPSPQPNPSIPRTGGAQSGSETY